MMRNPLSKKITGIEPSGIRKFFDLVSEMNDKDVISLGVGEPDFDTPWHVREEGIYSLEKGRTFYTGNSGLLELREEIGRYLDRRFGLSYSADEILVTVGGSEAIDIGFRTMLDPGDEVIIPEPCYVSYLPCVKLAGGVPVRLPLEEKDQFKLTKEKLLSAITDKTKILVLPFPNNPTGAILNREELQIIADIVKEHDLFVMSDEIYSELNYEGGHVSIASIPGMRENHCDQRIFQILCYDRMASGICSRTKRDHETDVEDPSVCDHVRAYYQPVCSDRGSPQRR